ncbi:MAG: DUF6265 family protein [Bacteroidota bacterium]
MRKIFLTLSCLLIVATACNPKLLTTGQKIKTLNQLQWLKGIWVTQTSVFTLVETWRQISDTVYKGSSIMLMGRDTVLNEKMSIETNKNNVMLYSKNLTDATSSFQVFTLTKLNKTKIVFQNPLNKDETKISYVVKSPDTMNISIEGSTKKVESFNMHKIIK